MGEGGSQRSMEHPTLELNTLIRHLNLNTLKLKPTILLGSFVNFLIKYISLKNIYFI